MGVAASSDQTIWRGSTPTARSVLGGAAGNGLPFQLEFEQDIGVRAEARSGAGRGPSSNRACANRHARFEAGRTAPQNGADA
jgi:hypothetical protein